MPANPTPQAPQNALEGGVGATWTPDKRFIDYRYADVAWPSSSHLQAAAAKLTPEGQAELREAIKALQNAVSEPSERATGRSGVSDDKSGADRYRAALARGVWWG